MASTGKEIIAVNGVEGAQVGVLGGLIKSKETALGLGLLAVVLVMMIPLPPILLDLCFVFSISLALVIFLIAVYTRHAIEFTIFPTILLLGTIFRLALNIASTRLILTHGA